MDLASLVIAISNVGVGAVIALILVKALIKTHSRLISELTCTLRSLNDGIHKIHSEIRELKIFLQVLYGVNYGKRKVEKVREKV